MFLHRSNVFCNTLKINGMKKYFFLFFFAILQIQGLLAQQTDTTDLRNDALNIYINCYGCDMEYIKEKINFVNYVRDIKEADVIIIKTSQASGNGGDKYSLIFEGNNKFKGINDTLVYHTNADETSDEIRKKDVKYMKIGLTKYVAHSPLVKNLEVNYLEEIETVTPTDKWKSWVFNIDGSAYVNAESSYKSLSASSSFSANKITEKWKIENEFSYHFSQSVFKIGDQKITSITRRNNFVNLTVRSLSEHWSAGMLSYAGNSTYTNKKLYLNSMPLVEYDIFPYSKSNIIQLRLQYGIGANYFQYYDTTIFDKTQEIVYNQRIGAAFRINKRWGFINTSLTYKNFLHDFSKNNLALSTSFHVRLFKGLTAYVYGNYSIIHDQLFLPKENLSYEEILLRQQQIATDYSYWVMVGLSYTFGSIYNNVVNPRFDNTY